MIVTTHQEHYIKAIDDSIDTCATSTAAITPDEKRRYIQRRLSDEEHYDQQTEGKASMLYTGSRVRFSAEEHVAARRRRLLRHRRSC
jgi:hypothetical protein